MKKAFIFIPLAVALHLLATCPLLAQERAGAPKATTEETEKAEHSESRPRALPFRSVVYSIDEENRAFFHMGKHKLRKVFIQPDTRFLLASGEAATVQDLRVGADIRGSYRKRPDSHYDAVTIKIGTKEREP